MPNNKKLKQDTPPVPYPLVMVEWEDSAWPNSGWQWVDDYELPQTILCISVGDVISKSTKAIAFAPNLGDLVQAKAQACNIIRIPQCAITQIRKLTVT